MPKLKSHSKKIFFSARSKVKEKSCGHILTINHQRSSFRKRFMNKTDTKLIKTVCLIFNTEDKQRNRVSL